MNYLVHNAWRKVETKAARTSSPHRRGLSLFVCGGRRVLRGRPMAITEEVLRAHLEELRREAKYGRLFVTGLDGRRLDLETLALAAAAPEAPLPVAQLDSVANDKNPEPAPFVPAYPGDKPPVDDVEGLMLGAADRSDDAPEAVEEPASSAPAEEAAEEPKAEESAPAAEEKPAAKPQEAKGKHGRR